MLSAARRGMMLGLTLGLGGLGPLAGAAAAAAPANPPRNLPPRAMPTACQSAPDGAACVNAAVENLDRARASLGQRPYRLPADFLSLGAARQAFILTNLDRVQYGLAPVPGLSSDLDADAAAGVRNDDDPQPRDRGHFPGYAANWAGGQENMAMAYYDWMYDDGYGSGNLSCTQPGDQGCWGHRQDVFFAPGSGQLAMGAAAGRDPQDQPGYAMLIGQTGGTGYSPRYSYTWAQARADGAGASGTPPPAVRLSITRLQVSGHRITVQIAAPTGTRLTCALTPRRGGKWGHDRFTSCGHTTVYTRVPRGRYRLTVRAAGQAAARTLSVN